MKKSVIVLWVIAALLLIGAVQLFTSNVPAAIFGLILAAVLGFFGFRSQQKHKAALEAARQAEAEREEARRVWGETHKFITFAVAGVTFKNDDGSSRQTILKRKRKENEDGTVTADLRVYEYEGKPAVAVYLDDDQIGSAPNSHLPEVLKAVESGTVEGLIFEIEDFENDDGKSLLRCDITFACEK